MGELITTRGSIGATHVDNLWITCHSRPLSIDIETLPPSTNHIWRNNGRGRVYKILDATRWEEHAIRAVRGAALDAYRTFDLEALTGRPLKLEIFVQRPTWHGKTKAKKHLYVRPDLSNYIKASEDALFRALLLDDSAVIELIAKKVEGPGIERTLLRLTFLEG